MSTASASSQPQPLLGSAKLMAFVATRDPARAKAFYGGVLGLSLVSEDGFAVVFDANGTLLRVQIVREVAPAQYTTLGWQVADIAQKVAELQQAGVKFENYSIPNQDRSGIWTAPGGARVAWFKDPEGYILSISQHE